MFVFLVSLSGRVRATGRAPDEPQRSERDPHRVPGRRPFTPLNAHDLAEHVHFALPPSSSTSRKPDPSATSAYSYAVARLKNGPATPSMSEMTMNIDASSVSALRNRGLSAAR